MNFLDFNVVKLQRIFPRKNKLSFIKITFEELVFSDIEKSLV